VEVLETKSSQSSQPKPISNFGLYLQSRHESCVWGVSSISSSTTILKPMNAVFSRPNNNPYAQTYNPGWRNHTNFSWSQNNNDHSQSNHSNHFYHSNNSSNHQPNFSNYHDNSSNHPPNFSNYQQNFSNQAPQSSFQNPQLERRMTNFERNMKRYMKNQDSFMQTIQRLEVQMSQLANP